MKKYLDRLKQVELFDSITATDIEAVLNCLNCVVRTYKKQETIILLESTISTIGIVLEGKIQIAKEDYLGNRSIIAFFNSGEMFGEAFACAGIVKSPVIVIAETETKVLFLEFKKIISTCSSACMFHTKLIENMLKIIAKKNIYLNNKIDVLSSRTIRDKILTYLLFQSRKQGDACFTIPFSRDEFADYLCVNRSALSRELSKMQDEGILTFNKNTFSLSDCEEIT